VIDYALRSRDGLPLLVGASGSRVNGYLLKLSNIDEAYTAVSRYVSPKHYLWLDDGLQVNAAGGPARANALRGRKPSSGADLENIDTWSSAKDPVFAHGIPVTTRLAAPFIKDESSATPWKALYHVQAAYLLLWSTVERLTALRFGPALDPMQRLRSLASISSWPDLLRQAGVPMADRRVVDSRDPDDAVRLKHDGSNACEYWYQVRSNLSHRGKGSHRDLRIVVEAFLDVHDVMRLLMLDCLPKMTEEWRRSDPDGEDRQWRLRPIVRKQT
jgi:hypothetical protein